MAVIARQTTWASLQTLTAAALNGEFNNIVNAWNNTDAGSTAWTTLVVSGALTANGKLVGKGTSTNDSAAAGYLGEILTASRLRSSGTSISTSTATNVLASPLSLTAGDWDVMACVGYIPDTTTSVTRLTASISVTSATEPSSDSIAVPNSNGEVETAMCFTSNVSEGNDYTIDTPITRVSISSTTPYYLVARTNFSISTMSVYGFIRARRIR